MSYRDEVARQRRLMKTGYSGIAAGAAIFAAVAIAAVLRGRDYPLACALVCAVAWGGGFATLIYAAAERGMAILEERLRQVDSSE